MSASASVLVVGGGYGGNAVAAALDPIADVTLIDPRDAFVHNIASLRALVEPAWVDEIFFPFDALLTRGRFVRDRAVAVEPGRVGLGSGGVLAADYVVLATGSRYPFPAKTELLDTAGAREQLRRAHADLARSSDVLICGAGAAGIELAGEIAHAMPAARVTMVDPAADVLSGSFLPGLREELRRQLEELGVQLRLGTRLTDLPAPPPAIHQPFEAATDDGGTVVADIWFRCFGVTPVTDYIDGPLASVRRPNGDIEVDAALRVVGQDRMFAIGDIVDVDGKLGAVAGRQGAHVAASIAALIAGATELAPYAPLAPHLFVPLGPRGGAGQRPGADEISGPQEVSQVKGQHMMVDPFRARFSGAPRAG